MKPLPALGLVITVALSAAPSSAQRPRRRPRRQQPVLQLAVTPAMLKLVPKMTGQAVLNVRNLSAALGRVQLQANAPGPWKVRLKTRQLLLPAYQTAAVPVVVQAPDTDDYKPGVITFRAQGGTSRGAECELGVVLVKPVEIVRVVPTFDAGGNALTAMTLRNNLGTAIRVTGTVRCTQGPQFVLPTPGGVLLKPRKPCVLALEPTGDVDPVRQYDVEAEAKVIGDGTVRVKGKLNYTPCFFVEKAPDIDGDLVDWSDRGTLRLKDQWPKLGSAPWNGEADLAATVRFRWTRENLYLAVEVTDNEHVGPAGKGGQGDGVVLSFPPVGRRKGRSAARRGTATTVSLALAGTTPVARPPGGIQFGAKETEVGVAYEVGLPFHSLGVKRPAEGMMVPIAVAVTDVDKTGRKTIRFFAGPLGRIPLERFGYLTLTTSTSFKPVEGEVIEGEPLEGGKDTNDTPAQGKTE